MEATFQPVSVVDRIHGHAELACRRMLARADIGVGTERPWDVQIHDRALYTRILRDGAVGVGDGYVDGQWDCDAIDELVARAVSCDIDRSLERSWTFALTWLAGYLLNRQARERAFRVGEEHYDLGNDLYEAMLDRRMTYTCAYWRDALTLDEAQEAKLDLVCRKLQLRPGMRVLDLGCGWGSFAGYAAERYGVEVVGYTVSAEQTRLGNERWAGLPVELRLGDFREATGTYDAVVSIGLMEHVGPKNHAAYMDVTRRCLRDDGIAFVHTIGGNRTKNSINPWFDKYIFPNAIIPSLAQIASAAERDFVIEDVHNIGEHYDRTLMAWHDNFVTAWPSLRARYGDRFYRMWRLYLLACAGAFRARGLQLFQIVLTPRGARQPACRAT